MHRRFFVIALLAASACARIGPKDEETRPRRLASGKPLLALAHWRAPVSGWNQWLAVYEDALLELRWFEDVPRKDNPFAREFRIRVFRVSPAELEPLSASLADGEFKTSESYYDEPGVHDGGTLTIADMATHRRRVTVVNSPPDLPKPVAKAQSVLDLLAKNAKHNGKDGFERGPDRVELVYMFMRGEENRHLTIFENGLVEQRTTYTRNDKTHEAADHPTPYALTWQADPGDLDALRASASALPREPPTVEHSRRTPDVLFAGSAKREFRVPLDPSPELIAVQSALEAILDSLELN